MGSLGRDKTGQDALPELIANRYRVEQLLGQGGMGRVYQVRDTATGRRLALKQLSAERNPDGHQEFFELFEREFHTLAHLSHPRVVEVYDYSKNETGPYYTMELLDGGDLRGLSPLPWATVCKLLCDVCSALSLLHSRRLVHRDVTPRNIHCTQDQKAKLIDFGAMTPVGPCKHVVGTPHFVPPEACNGRLVDARSDLFSLGATAYFALTGRHAYPGARSLDVLRDAWRFRPLPPSKHVADIPKELDRLVISLIHLDFMARPSNAAEVMERLSAIAGLHIDEQLIVRQAYLSTPTLVGRDDLLLRFRKQMVRTVRSRGGTVVIKGASGTGRSRFLDACVLEGKLAGAVVLRANAADANPGNWGAAQALARQLFDEVPQHALQTARPFAPVLGHVLPDLLSRLQPNARRDANAKTAQNGDVSDRPSERVRDKARASRPPPRASDPIALKAVDSPQALRPQVQAALCGWLLEVSKHRCLVVAVDDVHRIDEPSAAFVALLSQRAARQRLLVAVTVEADAPATSELALSLLSETGARMKVANLSLNGTEELLCSVFGDVPNVRLLANRLHAISSGNPRAIMQLAQHLLDTGLVRYQAGAWMLPDSIDTSDFPNTLGDALKARIQSLDADALELAQTMALCSKQSFSFDDCLALTAHRDKAGLIRDLDQLVASEIISTDGECYGLSQESWRPVLIQELAEDRAEVLHARLAELLKNHGGQDFRVAQHLLQANQRERALDVFLEHVRSARELHLKDSAAYIAYVRSLPRDCVDTCESLLALCEQLGRPRKDSFLLQAHLVSFDSVGARARTTHIRQVIQQLYHDSGLDLYEQQDDALDASVRLQRALEAAQQRFEAAPETERVLSPIEAIPNLALVILNAIGSVGNANDYAFMEWLPSLEPLAPLSPALGVVDKNRQSATHVNAGRMDHARRGFLEILDRMAQPDRAGLEGQQYDLMRLTIMYALGVIEVHAGLRSAGTWPDKIEQSPLFEVNAWRLRMLVALRAGDWHKAEECKRRVELLQIQNSPTQFFEGSHLLTEFMAYAASDDLVRVKQAISGIEKMAEQYPGWVPCLHYARAQYQRIRGDCDTARAELEQALSAVAPGRHRSWAPIAGGHLWVLLKLERFADVKVLAHEGLQAVEREQLGVLGCYFKEPLALAEAALNEFDRAVEHAQAVIDTHEASAAHGLALGSAYETRARVAITMGDHSSFRTYAQLCAEQYRAGQNQALTAKYEKLMEEAQRADLRVSSDLAGAADFAQEGQRTAAMVSTMLGACQGPGERARRTLALLVEAAGCAGGLLYTLQDQGPTLAAQQGKHQPPAQIDSLVTAYLSAEVDASDDVTVTEADVADRAPTDGAWVSPDGHRFVPLVLAHDGDAGFTVAGVVVFCAHPNHKLDIPFRLLPVLSRSLLEAGDVVTARAAT